MTATLIGSTGLIGNYLLEKLLQDNYFEIVKILVRRPMEFNHPKLEKKLVDFTDMENLQLAIEGSDVVFCAIGTTQQKVKGDKAAYRKVDYDIPVKTAQLAKLSGCKVFILVSSIGANSKSSNFYLKLKGEMEDAINAIQLKSVHIMQPSLLLGNRKEKRRGEIIAKKIMPLFSLLIPSKYKPIQGKDVANAMIILSKSGKQGFNRYAYKEIKALLSHKEK